jgi:hypothetical protein
LTIYESTTLQDFGAKGGFIIQKRKDKTKMFNIRFNMMRYIIHKQCKTCTRLKSHHKWVNRRLRATRLLAILLLVLHRKGPKCPRKPIRSPYTTCPAVSQEQSTKPSWHLLRPTKPPKSRTRNNKCESHRLADREKGAKAIMFRGSAN